MTVREGATDHGGTVPGGYGEAPPPPVLAGRVACLWWVTRPGDDDGGPPVGQAVLPDGAVDLVWHAGRLTIAGPDTAARTATPGSGAAVGVRLRPGAATTFGESAAALRDRQPSAEELWGAEGRRLAERVAGAPGPWARLDLLATAVGRRVRDAPPTDPVVDGAVAALRRGGTGLAAAPGVARRPAMSPTDARGHDGQRPLALGVAGIAAGSGVSERQLRRRFHEHVGYGPKTLDRILRLQRFLALAIATDESLAGLAALAGYADQPHLARETRALAGATTSDLVAARRPGPRTGPGPTATDRERPWWASGSDRG